MNMCLGACELARFILEVPYQVPFQFQLQLWIGCNDIRIFGDGHVCIYPRAPLKDIIRENGHIEQHFKERQKDFQDHKALSNWEDSMKTKF